jgi:hypothetical protein
MRAGGRFRRGGRPGPEPEPNPADSHEPVEAREAGEPVEVVEAREAGEATEPVEAVEPEEAVEPVERTEAVERAEAADSETSTAQETALPDSPLQAEKSGTQSRSGRRKRAPAGEEALEEDVELLVSFPLEEPPEVVPVMEEGPKAAVTAGTEAPPDTSEGFFGSTGTPVPAEDLAPVVIAPRATGRAGPARPDPIRFARLHLRTGSLIRARSEYEALAADGVLDLAGTLDLAEVRWRTADSAGAGLAAAAYLAAGGMEPLGFLIAAESAAREERIIDARDFAVRASAMGLDNLEALFAGVPRRMDWPKDMWGLPVPPIQPQPHRRMHVEVVDAEVRVTEPAAVEPALPEAAPSEPALPEAAPSEPALPEAAPSEPALPEAAPTEPALPEAAPTEPAAVEALPVEPALPEAAPTEAISAVEDQAAPSVEPSRLVPLVETPESAAILAINEATPPLAGPIEQEAEAAGIETPEIATPDQATSFEPAQEAVLSAEPAPGEPAPAELAPAEMPDLYSGDAMLAEAAAQERAEEEAPEPAPAAAEPEAWWTVPHPRSEDFAADWGPSQTPLPEAPAADVEEPGSLDVEPAAPPERAPAAEPEPRGAAEPNPLDAEIAAGRDALASGDALVAALHLAVALRISPAAASTVLEVIGSHDEVALELVRGDALRLLGEAATQPVSLIGGVARPDAPPDARPEPTDARPGEPPDREPDSSGQLPDSDRPLRWE